MAATLTFDILARDRASATLNRVGGAADNTGKRFKAFHLVAAAAGTAVGVAVVKFGKDSIRAFADAEESQKRLEFAFQKFPKLADVNIESLRSLDTALQKKTKFDDDAIASGQALLAQFGLTGKQITETTPLLLDYASATGKDVTGAARDVGKALLGNAKALKNIGIAYKSTGNATVDFANITSLMRQKVGGFAETEGKTAAGRLAILKNQFGELQEQVGAKLLPAMAGLAKVSLAVVGAFGHLNPQTQQLALALTALAIAALLVGPRIATMGTALKEAGVAAGGLSKGVGVASVALIAFQVTADASIRKAADMSKSFGERAVEAFRAVAKYGGMSGTAIAAAANESDKAKGSTDNLTTAADQYQQILGEVTPAVQGLADATENAYQKQQLLNGVLLDATEADISFRDAVASWTKNVRDATKAGDKHTHSLSLNNQAGRDNISALTGMAKKVNDHAQAVFNQTGSLGKANMALKTDRQRLLDAGKAAGFNRDELRKLIDRYLKVPTKAQTKIEQPGMAGAQSKAAGLKKKMDDIDRTFHARVRASVSGSGAIDNLAYKLGQLPTHINVSVGARVTMGGAFLGRQHGGPVMAGHPYIVGEKRPELFIPNQSGWIKPSVGGGGGGLSVVNVTVYTAGVVGMTKMDLENALVSTINRVAGQGRLDHAVRVAAR